MDVSRSSGVKPSVSIHILSGQEATAKVDGVAVDDHGHAQVPHRHDQTWAASTGQRMSSKEVSWARKEFLTHNVLCIQL